MPLDPGFCGIKKIRYRLIIDATEVEVRDGLNGLIKFCYNCLFDFALMDTGAIGAKDCSPYTMVILRRDVDDLVALNSLIE
jgi:hypothetical protein